MTEKEYGKLVKKHSPKSPIGKDCLLAFIIGGLICTLGQVFMNMYAAVGLDKTNAGVATPKIPSTLKNISMKAFHDSVQRLEPIDIDKVF